MNKRLVMVWSVVLLAGSMAMPAHADPKSEARRVLQKFGNEPTVVDVQQAAMRYARVNPDAYDGWLATSHWAYVLPRSLRGRLRSTTADQNDVRTTSAGSGSLSDLVSKDNQMVLELQADWDLTRIVFNRDQIATSRQIERIVNQREDLLTTVNKLYFARRQLQVDLELDPASSVEKAVKSQLRVDALTADLDALTGGWFSKQLPRVAE
jgi:hypothetical protein